jgi:hypothetical protein
MDTEEFERSVRRTMSDDSADDNEGFRKKMNFLMAEHVWKKHRHEAEKAVREYWEALGA